MKKQPPRILSKKAKKIFKEIQLEYEIFDKAGCLLLQAAMESWDIQQDALKSIKEEGILIKGTHETLKKSPAVQIERDSKAMFLSSLKALNLSYEAENHQIGRPPRG